MKMDRDTITRTGARTPGAEGRTPRTAAFHRITVPTLSGEPGTTTESAKGEGKPCDVKGTPGAGLTGKSDGKASSERPALKPY